MVKSFNKMKYQEKKTMNKERKRNEN
jgi:hypothetical protein